MIDELLGQIDVIIQRVLLFRRIRNITRVANGTFDDPIGVSHAIDAEFQVIHVVQRIKHAKDIDTGFSSLGGKFLDDVVSVGGITDRIRTSQ